MTRTRLILMLAGLALVMIGALAGSVIGAGGTSRTAARFPTVYPAAETITIGGAERRGGADEPQIISGRSKKRTVGSGAIDSLRIKCPKKTVAISAGFNTEGPSIVPLNIGRVPGKARSYFVAVINTTGADLWWRADITCADSVQFE